MTTIRLHYAQGTLVGFEAKGHSGAGEAGHDLVCAAVSFLATTCANALESVAGERPRVKVADGYLEAILDLQHSPQAATILKTFRQGALDLRESYPSNVRLIDQASREERYKSC